MGLLRHKIHLQENPTENIFKMSNEPSSDHGPNELIRFRPKVDHKWSWPHSGWKKTTSAEAFQDGRAVDLTAVKTSSQWVGGFVASAAVAVAAAFCHKSTDSLIGSHHRRFGSLGMNAQQI